MTDLGVHLEGDDRESFKQRLLLPFHNHKEASEWLPVSEHWIDSYSSGRQQVIKLDTLREFGRFLENTDLELLDRNIRRRLSEASVAGRESSARPELKSDWKNYLFDLFGNKGLAEMSDYSKQTVKNYSPGFRDRNPPQDFWEDVNRETENIYRETRLETMRADLVDLGAYLSAHDSPEKATIARDVPLSEIFFLEDMAQAFVDLRESSPFIDSSIDSYDVVFEQVLEELEKGNSYISPKSYDIDCKQAGFGLSVLEDIGIVQDWSDSNRSTYQIVRPYDTVKRAQMLFSPDKYGLDSGLDQLAEEGFGSLDFETLYN